MLNIDFLHDFQVGCATPKQWFRNNYFIGPNYENAVGFFVGGEKSLLLSNFGSELSEKRVKNLVKQYDFRVKRENHILMRFFSCFLSFRLKNGQ